MSSALWVTRPGGVSVATDEILELIDQLTPITRATDTIADDLAGLSTRWDGALLSPSRTEAEDLSKWTRWLVSSLDTYCQQVADNERFRRQLWSAPAERALSTLVGYGTGQPDTRGMSSAAALDDAAAALVLEGYAPEVEVTLERRSVDQTVSLTVAERIARIPDTDSPIRIERFPLDDGSHHVEVFIAGTSEWGLQPGTSPFDMPSNFALVAGLPAASLMATESAIRKAGVTSRDRVVFVGHSQGGAVAATLAESGRYSTAGLITVGAPTGSIPVTGQYPALVIEHSDDVVPSLGGYALETQAYRVTTESGALPGDLIGAHEKDGYVDTAQRIDQSPDRRLRDLFSGLPRGVRGVASEYQAVQT